MLPIVGGGSHPARIARTDLLGNPVPFGHRFGPEPMHLCIDRGTCRTLESLAAALDDIERVLAHRKTPLAD